MKSELWIEVTFSLPDYYLLPHVRSPDCGEEVFVAFSCRQRSCCPSCDQKRALLLGHRLRKDVFAPVLHRQWVFTIPKRLRIDFRYDRKLLGRLCRAAWETIRDLYALEANPGSGIGVIPFPDSIGN